MVRDLTDDSFTNDTSVSPLSWEQLTVSVID
jgi:hypothetical protein